MSELSLSEQLEALIKRRLKEEESCVAFCWGYRAPSIFLRLLLGRLSAGWMTYYVLGVTSEHLLLVELSAHFVEKRSYRFPFADIRGYFVEEVGQVTRFTFKTRDGQLFRLRVPVEGRGVESQRTNLEAILSLLRVPREVESTLKQSA